MSRRWLIPLAAMLLLWWLVAQLNHYLAPHGMYLFVGGLLVTFAALRLRLRTGLTATLLTGLAIDAAEPGVPFGTHFVLFAAVHVILFHLRTRFPREETAIEVATALLANLALFLAFSVVALSDHPAPGGAWLRLFADLCWSQLLVAAIAPWYFALQERALELGRIDLVEEHRRSL
jgi:rod shape-determining protein MreD